MRIGFLITARLKSSRLKRKILLDLNGSTVLDHVIKRAKKVKNIDGVVLCTSTNTQDLELKDYAVNNNIYFFKGSEDDVLKRLYDAARYFGFDGFLSITADNPLHSFTYSNKIIDLVKKNNFDFIFSEGLPLGIVPYYLKTNALEIALEMKIDSDTEIWGPFVKRSDFFNICDIIINNKYLNSSFRLTCDYNDDYKLLKKLLQHFEKDYLPSFFDIEKLFIENPEMKNININSKQTKVSQKTLLKINAHFNKSIKTGKILIRKNQYKIIPGYCSINM